MDQEGRRYLLIALWGLVVAGLFSALAAYLAALLVSVLVDTARDARYSMGPLIYAAPFYLAAAAMPFWGVKVFWQVLCVSWSDLDQRALLRRSGIRLLTWSSLIYLGLALVIVVMTAPGTDRSIVSGLSVMAGIGLFAVTPLILLLTLRSPIGRGDGP